MGNGKSKETLTFTPGETKFAIELLCVDGCKDFPDGWKKKCKEKKPADYCEKTLRDEARLFCKDSSSSKRDDEFCHIVLGKPTTTESPATKIIIGCVIGGIVLFLLIAGVVFWKVKKNRQKPKNVVVTGANPVGPTGKATGATTTGMTI